MKPRLLTRGDVISMIHTDNKRGFASLVIILLLSSASVIIGSGIAQVAFITQRTIQTSIQSLKSYYAVEAGIEDAVYRIQNAISYSPTYTLGVNNTQATITISQGGIERTVISDGDTQSIRKQLQATLQISTQSVQFNFGVQVGEGGLQMGNGSSIVGNVFSNGDIQGGGASNSSITGTAQVAGSHTLEEMEVLEDAYAGNFDDCVIGGVAHYVTTFTDCTASLTQLLSPPLSPQSFPISQTQIDAWKNDAASGGTIGGDYILSNNQSATLGPKKIEGDMKLTGNNVTLTLTGTVWVTGKLDTGNDTIIILDPGYGSTSGVLIVEGSINPGNNATFSGSGDPNSYIMLLSEFGPGSAINLGNNATSAIFYAPNGIISIGNGLNLKEAVGYGLSVGNNASITYETGLANAQFSSGPGGSFEITSWNEI